ncbi:phage portal protein [Paenibacillus macerans]|uniref:phage portal protein n=1 Tax=Paenibacillus macerans TaxID=44252 RepID=UPI00204216CF|nr:phage portal protein [Paenibacillus macerans]MCM3701442.1 phage portal protein [Paenibacillus macerans]
MSTLVEILENLDANAPMTIDEIVQVEVSDWESDKRRELMEVGEEYYLVHNDVLKREKKTIDEDGREVKAKHVADNRIPHGFVRKLVDQKTDYLLARPFMVETDNVEYQKELDEIFDMAFKEQLKHQGTTAINAGISWMQVYYDDDSKLSFQHIPSIEAIPIWKDAAHTELAAFIRVYERVEYVVRTKQTVKCVEFWHKDGVRFYESDGGALKFVEEKNILTLEGLPDGEQLQFNWEKIPFQWFKYNNYEQPLIDIIKRLVDDYDNQKSDNSSNLEDLPNGIYVVNNFGGTQAGEFRKNIATYRVAFTREGGDVKTISMAMNNEGYAKHMEQTRKDIYEFGRGVDTQSASLGNSPSGIALRFLYSDLDMDANAIESQFQASLQRLLWFINKHLLNTKKVDYSNEKVTFIFNRDIIINETEAVKNAKDSVGIISNETIVANHPWPTNTKEEMKKIEKEKVGELEKTDPYNNLNQEETPNGEPS